MAMLTDKDTGGVMHGYSFFGFIFPTIRSCADLFWTNGHLASYPLIVNILSAVKYNRHVWHGSNGEKTFNGWWRWDVQSECHDKRALNAVP